MLEFLKSETFKIVGSAIIGIGIMAVLKPVCQSNDCRVLKAPPVEEITKSTYQIGQKCYKFETSNKDCPKEGVIEPFKQGLGA
jgi:hypothetical protein